MGNGTSIRKFNGLTTAGEDVFFDVGALSRNAGFLSRGPGALNGNAKGLIGNPDTLSSNPEALSFDTETLSFDPDTLSFEVFHQRRDFNRLISSHLRGIASKPSKFAFPNFQLLSACLKYQKEPMFMRVGGA
jgi:hypothetical protein